MYFFFFFQNDFVYTDPPLPFDRSVWSRRCDQSLHPCQPCSGRGDMATRIILVHLVLAEEMWPRFGDHMSGAGSLNILVYMLIFAWDYIIYIIPLLHTQFLYK